LSQLQAIFLIGGNSTAQCLDIAKALQRNPNVHPHLWFYALSSLASKNPDLEGIHRVSPVEALPDIFVNAETLQRARRQGKRRRRQGQVNYTNLIGYYVSFSL